MIFSDRLTDCNETVRDSFTPMSTVNCERFERKDALLTVTIVVRRPKTSLPAGGGFQQTNNKGPVYDGVGPRTSADGSSTLNLNNTRTLPNKKVSAPAVMGGQPTIPSGRKWKKVGCETHKNDNLKNVTLSFAHIW